ncbi:NAD-dependent epimerase/dehydratase [Caballeronia turbans]|uniref:hypothetical protein n=1 Tax=unclassified Caballeronia TaxID=2646786 RepID=UPI00074C7DCC|nr:MULTISPECIES: hypothetical protein [unclassified Caballeronia]SAL22964.1 NAD-dependent epimerase/dehydratase [Caballeronia turbans]
MNGVVEIAGPDRSRLSDLMQRYFKVTGDARTVFADESALYFGAQLAADTLLPGGQAHLGTMYFDAWFERSQSRTQTAH